MSPLITVVVPTYNRAWTINQALQSVADQTYQNFECIIVDDGSTDETPQVVRSFLQNLSKPQFQNPPKDNVNINAKITSDACDTYNTYDTNQTYDTPLNGPKFRLISTPNQGVAAARNLGVANSHPDSKYIAFLDDDDHWHPEKLAIQVKYHHKNPDIQISQCQERWVRNNQEVKIPKHLQKVSGEIFHESLQTCTIGPSAVFMEKTLFHEFQGFDISYIACEDYELWLRITAKYPVGLQPIPLMTKFAGHSDQLSTSITVLDLFRLRAMIKLCQTTTLSTSQTKALQITFQQKAQVIHKGATKRGNVTVLKKLEVLHQEFSKTIS